MKYLILGGVRSGKSRFAENVAIQRQQPVTYVATAQALDGEMKKRIQRHQSHRPKHWSLVEEPIALAAVLQAHCKEGEVVLVDCLTLWLTNLICTDHPERLTTEQYALMDALPNLPGTVIFVSNEVGQGVIPENAMARRFVDLAGILHQEVASRCDKVVFMTAGLPHFLKK